MQSKAASPKEYLDGLPEDRRRAIDAVRTTILKNLPKGYEESMNYGFLTYQVPLSVYPDTYNKQPLMYAALASQKGYMAVHLMCVYGSGPLKKQLVAGFKAAGKKLDMGKACIRFKTLDDLSLDLIGKLIAAVPMKDYVAVAQKAHAKKK